MGNKHKHYDLIVAWASGEDIQFRNYYGDWEDVCSPPNWIEEYEYRVKPKNKEVFLHVYYDPSCIDNWDYFDLGDRNYFPNIKCIFDGNGELISVEKL